MISINSSLASAATSEVRSPNLRVTAESISPDMTNIHTSSTHVVHRIRYSSGYAIATAYNPDAYYNNTIYAKTLTDPDNGTQWSTSWTTVASGLGAYGYRHDLWFDGSTALIVYVDDGTAYWTQSSPSPQSWSTPAILSTHGNVGDSVANVAILDDSTVYCVTNLGTIYRVVKSGGSWSDESDCPYNLYFDQLATSARQRIQFHARSLTNDHELIVFNGQRSDDYGAYAQPVIVSMIYKNGYEFMRVALGHDIVESDYWHTLTGLSQSINGYFFGTISERYIKAADGSMFVPDSSYEMFFARTKDMVSWNMIPSSMISKESALYHENAEDSYTAGFIEDSSGTIVTAMSDPTYGSKIYTCPSNSWWGRTPNETNIPANKDISLSASFDTATNTQIDVSNGSGDYTEHSIARPGSIVRIYGGYNGLEQKRFTGRIISLSRSIGHDPVVSFNVVDNLWMATSIKQSWPQILRGHNAMYIDTTDSYCVDYFVEQSGTWQYNANTYEMTELGTNSISLMGYEPDRAHFVHAKIRFNNEITNHKGGVILNYPVLESDVVWAWVVLYNDVTNKIEISIIDTRDFGNPSSVDVSTSNFNWSANTDYYILAKIKYNQIKVWTSLTGTSWTLAVSSDVDAGYVGSRGYPGLYAYLASGSTAEPSVRFSDVYCFSAEKQQSGSDVMEYMAGVVGIDTDEKKEIYDEFTDPANAFSTEWEDPLYGSWSVSGGRAYGQWSDPNPGIILANLETGRDVIVKSTVIVTANDAGVVARWAASNEECYAATISSTYAKILRFGPGWITLSQIPYTFSGNVEIVFCIRMGYLSLYANGNLCVGVYDDAITGDDGTGVGMYSMGTAATRTQHDLFEVQGWSRPIDVVSIRPGDTMGSVMSQIASMHSDGRFFCDYKGELRYGIFDSSTVDIDIRNLSLDQSFNYKTDQVLTHVRATGEGAMGEYRTRDWATRLGGHRYEHITINSATTGNTCYDIAESAVKQSQCISEYATTIKGNPAIELGDVLGVAEVPTGTQLARMVISYSETIGSVYEQSFDELGTIMNESPPT